MACSSPVPHTMCATNSRPSMAAVPDSASRRAGHAGEQGIPSSWPSLLAIPNLQVSALFVLFARPDAIPSRVSRCTRDRPAVGRTVGERRRTALLLLVHPAAPPGSAAAAGAAGVAARGAAASDGPGQAAVPAAPRPSRTTRDRSAARRPPRRSPRARPSAPAGSPRRSARSPPDHAGSTPRPSRSPPAPGLPRSPGSRSRRTSRPPRR